MIRTEVKGRDAGGMDTYLREIRATGLLSAAEERSLAGAIAAGDEAARSRMIRANLRLVVRIAREYVGRGMGLDDLIGEGNLGLIRAAEDFDPAFGTRFSTYASYWIKQSIRHALTNTGSTIRLPAHMVTLLAKWRKAERALARELGRTATADEVADHLGLTEAQRTMAERAQQASRLRPEGGDGESGWTPEEAGDHRETPDAVLEADDERRELRGRLDRLDDRERTIVALRFGLDGETPMTLKQVGQRLGVTREWVRKIEVRALGKLDGDARIAAEPPSRPAPRRRSAAPFGAAPALGYRIA